MARANKRKLTQSTELKIRLFEKMAQNSGLW
jgi:hypothetical protein